MGCLVLIHAYLTPFKWSVNNHLESCVLFCGFFIATMNITYNPPAWFPVTIAVLAMLPLIPLPILFYDYWALKGKTILSKLEFPNAFGSNWSEVIRQSAQREANVQKKKKEKSLRRFRLEEDRLIKDKARAQRDRTEELNKRKKEAELRSIRQEHEERRKKQIHDKAKNNANIDEAIGTVESTAIANVNESIDFNNITEEELTNIVDSVETDVLKEKLSQCVALFDRLRDIVDTEGMIQCSNQNDAHYNATLTGNNTGTINSSRGHSASQNSNYRNNRNFECKKQNEDREDERRDPDDPHHHQSVNCNHLRECSSFQGRECAECVQIFRQKCEHNKLLTPSMALIHTLQQQLQSLNSLILTTACHSITHSRTTQDLYPIHHATQSRKISNGYVSMDKPIGIHSMQYNDINSTCKREHKFKSTVSASAPTTESKTNHARYPSSLGKAELTVSRKMTQTVISNNIPISNGHASMEESMGMQYNDKTSKNRNKFKSMVSVCDTTIDLYPTYRAKKNIKVSHTMTSNTMPNAIREHISNGYAFVEKSIGMQYNDGEIVDNPNTKYKILNVDCYDKYNNPLYCVMKRMPPTRNANYQWQMKDKLFTESEVTELFSCPLPPRSSRVKLHGIYNSAQYDIKRFSFDLQSIHGIIKEVKQRKWNSIPIFKKKENKQRLALAMLQITRAMLQIKNDTKRLIPILMFDNALNTHWIEYILVIHIQNDIDIGISLRYDAAYGVKITGVHLSKVMMMEQHEVLLSHSQLQDKYEC
eukprot:776051_1